MPCDNIVIAHVIIDLKFANKAKEHPSLISIMSQTKHKVPCTANAACIYLMNLVCHLHTVCYLNI